jgi:hypothetical protein
MRNLWLAIPFGALMIWCVIQFFRGGGPPSGRDESSTSGYDWGGRD